MRGCARLRCTEIAIADTSLCYGGGRLAALLPDVWASYEGERPVRARLVLVARGARGWMAEDGLDARAQTVTRQLAV